MGNGIAKQPMNAILICPGERSNVGFLSVSSPLINVPLLGEPVIGHWLTALHSQGYRRALILAADRPEQTACLVDHGARWGVHVEVRSETRELLPEEALRKYGQSELPVDAASVFVIDHLPGLEFNLFESYCQWFSSALAWLPHWSKQPRVGITELQPGVWIGMRTHVAPSARLIAPCWLGDNVWIGEDAVIGPNAIVEHRVVIESAAEVVQSFIGPETFVGSLTTVNQSIAWGSMLVNWRNGSCTTVPDAFLLCPLTPGSFTRRYHYLTSRLTENFINSLTRPFEFLAAARAKLGNR
jgi:NDP-sugar pyrophosphorylase family protein